MEFFYNEGRIEGRAFSVTFPDGMYIKLFDAMRPTEILHFVKRSDEAFNIEIAMERAEGRLSREKIELYIDDMGCEVDEISPICKGRKKGYSCFYHSSTADYYEEWYRVKEAGKLYDLQFCVWTDLIDYPEICGDILRDGVKLDISKHLTKISVKKVLERDDVKAFFSSIKIGD